MNFKNTIRKARNVLLLGAALGTGYLMLTNRSTIENLAQNTPTQTEFQKPVSWYINYDTEGKKGLKSDGWAYVKFIDRDKDGSPDIVTDGTNQWYFVNKDYAMWSDEKKNLEDYVKSGKGREMNDTLQDRVNMYHTKYQQLQYEYNKANFDSTGERHTSQTDLYVFDVDGCGKADVIKEKMFAEWVKDTKMAEKIVEEGFMEPRPRIMPEKLRNAATEFLEAHKELTKALGPVYFQN